MILSRPDILNYLSEKRLRFDPPLSEDSVAQVSVDLRLGRKFTTFKDPPAYLTSINVDPSLWKSADLWQHFEQPEFKIAPGQFVLAQTLERISMPWDLVGFVEGRSSWARVGVAIHITAPKIDPGFDAHITLELYNFGRVSVNLRSGVDKPAQLMLLRITTPLKDQELYGAGKDDTFQGQTTPIPHRKA